MRQRRQSGKPKESTDHVKNKSTVKQIIKFEKLMEQFCDQLGLEKKNLLSILYGPKHINQLKGEVDTGKAAILAYTNLDLEAEPSNDEISWQIQ